jgi:6-phosphofructokinase
VRGYIQLGGSPTRFDRMLAARMGVDAAEALLDGQSDMLVTWRNNQVEVQDVGSLAPQPDPWDKALDRVHRITTTQPLPETGSLTYNSID